LEHRRHEVCSHSKQHHDQSQISQPQTPNQETNGPTSTTTTSSAHYLPCRPPLARGKSEAGMGPIHKQKQATSRPGPRAAASSP
jgi:hypothetical protein